MRILVFGTGHIYERNKHRLKDFDVLAFLDNDILKQGKKLDGIRIDCPKNHNKYQYDTVIIMSVHYKEMRLQLLELGIPYEKIIDEGHRGVFENVVIKKEYIVKKNKDIKFKILLVSNELTNTGAPNVLLNLACILEKNNYSVDLLTCQKGPMLYNFINAGINVYIYEWSSMIETCFFEKYNLIILNTVLVNDIAKKLIHSSAPVLWWLHEDELSLKEYGITRESIPIAKNIHPLAVSERVKRAYIKCTHNRNIEYFCYGLENHICVENRRKHRSKYVCAVIGYVNKVKGQDLLLEALKKHKNKWQDILEIWLIGDISEKDRMRFEQFSCIRVWGSLEHNRLMELFSDIDIVLCTSRYESLSATVIEGMMHKKLCIVSSETGIAEYCNSHKNALIFESENIESLSNEIHWAINNQDKWKQISEEGYKIYDEMFRIEAFEKNTLKIIDKYLQ